LLYDDKGWLMEAVQSEDVADKGREGAFLTGCAGIRSRAVVSPKASLARTASEQSRDSSSSANARTTQSQSPLPSKTSHFCSKLNRQKIQFCKSQNLRSTSANACPEPFSRRLARFAFLEPNQPLSNRELLVLEILQRAENKRRLTVLIENFEPNDSRSFRAFVAAAFRRAAFACESPIQAGEWAKPEGRSK
jgi:hypothetical protein